MYIWLSPKWKGLEQYKPKLRKAGGTLCAINQTLWKAKSKKLMSANFLLSFFLLSFFTICQAQTGKLRDDIMNNSAATKIIFVESLQEARDLAKIDIANQTPILLLQSGIAPTVYSTDFKFEEKYKVYFNDSGCSGPAKEFAIEYNNTIFEYLTNKYGKKWMKEIRKDVIGFKDYKRRN